MRLEHHLVGGYVRYISPHIIIIINLSAGSIFYTIYINTKVSEPIGGGGVYQLM